MFRRENLWAMFWSLLAGLMVSFAIVSVSYMELHDFGQRFLDARYEDGFWKAALALFITLSLIIYLIWGSKALGTSRRS